MIGLDDVKQLLAQADHQTLTLYLLVDPAVQENQANPPAWRIWLKNALRDVEKGMNEEQRERWHKIRPRVETYFQTEAPPAKGLALFYGTEWEAAYPLPVPVENRIAFGKPLLTPLLWALDEYQPHLVVQVDNEKAQFITAYLGSTGNPETMALELDTSDWREKTLMPSASGRGGTGVTHGDQRERFEDRVGEWVERFYREVVGRIEEIVQERRIDRVILGGTEEAAHAVKRLLPDKLAKTIIDVQAIPLRATPHEVLKQVSPAALEYERKHEMELVEQVINLAKAGGRGALGPEAVLAALDQQRVELLIVPWPLAKEGQMADLPLRTLENNSQIELVYGEAAARLQAEGGLGARLYYAL